MMKHADFYFSVTFFLFQEKTEKLYNIKNRLLMQYLPHTYTILRLNMLYR